MKKRFLLTFGIALMALAGTLNAQVTIQTLDIRGTGIFGTAADDPVAGVYLSHVANIGASSTLNGGAFGAPRVSADPTDVQMTYSNLDLDGDTTANDSVTFTIRWEKVDFDSDGLDGGDLGAFNQGIDTGFGNLNDMQISVINVTGTTTDSSSTIYFDGFTRAALGGGSGADLDRTAEVNGTTVTFASPSAGAFQFLVSGVDFATPVPTVSIDNSGDTDLDGNGDGGLGSIVARNYDLQFSLTEPNGTPLLGDVNLDGEVTFLDIAPFIELLSTQGFQAEADIDLDLSVTFLDIQPFIDILAGN